VTATSELPTGTVTFLFTDIEGSTRLLQTLGDRYAQVLEDQRRLLREAFQRHSGREVGTAGDGFFVVFLRPRDAVAAAVDAQRAVARHTWPEGVTVRVRMGLHTGEGALVGGDYVGLDVHRAARIASVGWGGQILLSQSTGALIEHGPPDGVTLRGLGPHRLKDLARPEDLFQVLHRDLPHDFPALHSLDAMPNNLPVQLTSFIGREQEIADIKRSMATTHLLTLLGPGGAGKTRLALQIAAECVDLLHDGVWLVDLAPISDPSLVAQTAASAVGLREPARGPLEALVDFLRPKSLMLVLDNCEHVLAAAADLCSGLLRQAPNLRILATSRETLGITGELVYRVPPLPLPDPQDALSPEGVGQFAAVRLFVERATFQQPGFAVTKSNAKVIAAICRRLDGIPLAIELAAARVKVLSLDQIAARLNDRFRLLTGGARTGVPHHQTLRAAMDWSYDLLPEEERALFRRLSVFVGGFTLEAAESVCADAGLDSSHVLDLLSHLVDKSLVTVDDRAGSEVRYRLLETIRQYSFDRMVEGGEVERVRNRHRDFYQHMAERAELELTGPEQKTWLDRLEIEHDNYRAALEWSIADAKGAEAATRLAGSLWWFWEVRGYWSEARRWLNAALARTEGVSAAARAKALNAASGIALRQYDMAESKALAQESLELSRQLGDKRTTASCLVILGTYACRVEDYKQAEQLSGESLTLSREAGDNWGTAWAQGILGLVAREEKDYTRATALMEESIQGMRALGTQWGMGIMLVNLGLVTREQGDLARAVSLFEEALGVLRQLGDKSYISYTQLNMGAVASAMGEHARAAQLYGDSLALRKELEDRRGMATCVAALGCTAAGLGDFDRAARLLGAAEAMRERIGGSIPALIRKEHEGRVAETRQALGEDRFKTAWAAGRTLPAEQAIELALASVPVGAAPSS